MAKHIPNILTVARFFLIPFVIYFLVVDNYLMAFIFLTNRTVDNLPYHLLETTSSFPYRKDAPAIIAASFKATIAIIKVSGWGRSFF